MKFFHFAPTFALMATGCLNADLVVTNLTSQSSSSSTTTSSSSSSTSTSGSSSTPAATESATQLAWNHPNPTKILHNTCKLFTIHFLDSTGAQKALVSAKDVSFSATPTSSGTQIQFYSDASCTNQIITSVIIPAGSSSLTVYFKAKMTSFSSPNFPWNLNLSVSDTSSKLASSSLSVTVKRAEVSTGGYHTCAIIDDDVYCWGGNSDYQLGFSGADTKAPTSKSVTSTQFSSNTTGVAQVFAGYNTSCMITRTGWAKCWGGNANGVLGANTSTNLLATTGKLDVYGFSSGASVINIGYQSACAVKDSNVYCWGKNENGVLGSSTGTNSYIPVLISSLTDTVNGISPVDVSLYGGGYDKGSTACAVLSSGYAKCWGSNQAGELGDNQPNSGTTLYRSNPDYVKASSTSNLTGFSKIAVGGTESTAGLNLNAGGHVCAVLNGGIMCWGRNTYAELGLGCYGKDAGCDPYRNLPIETVAFVSGATDITTGVWHSCALVNNSVKCWGRFENVYYNTSPAVVTGLSSGVQSISKGSATSRHFCAVVEEGDPFKIKCFGNNSNGQLGNNSLTSTASVVEVVLPP